MPTEHRLQPELYRTIVRFTPLVSVDIIIVDDAGYVLVGLRSNEPAQGTYFVPGGIIFKDERIDEAFQRILMAETGLHAFRSDASPLGLFEHFYPTNRYREPGYGTHYVVNAFRLILPRRPEIKLDEQHRDIRWLTPGELLAAADVHENTKVYFR